VAGRHFIPGTVGRVRQRALLPTAGSTDLLNSRLVAAAGGGGGSVAFEDGRAPITGCPWRRDLLGNPLPAGHESSHRPPIASESSPATSPRR